MIEFLLLAVLNDPEKILPYPKERAGVADYDKNVYIYALPSVAYPIVSMPYTLTDRFGNVLPPGHYEVALSDARDFLLMIQSNKIVAKIPVVGLEEQQVSREVEHQKYLEEEKAKKKRKKNNEKDMTKFKLEAHRKATIGDSKEGYYILNYKNGNIKAWGYIPY